MGLRGALAVAAAVAAGTASGAPSGEEQLRVREYPVPSGTRPHDVAPARDGGVWFTAQGSGQLGWLNPKTGETRLTRLGSGSAPHGVIAILGNHDDERETPAALAAKGFTVLKDARTRLTIRGEVMDFAGIRFWTYKVAEIAHVLKGAVSHTILLAHSPKRLIEARQLAVPAVISGHTHGGQIVLPGIGAIAAREFPVIAGLEQRQGTTIFVSRGVGTVYVPVRINCPPEVAVLTLEPVTRT